MISTNAYAKRPAKTNFYLNFEMLKVHLLYDYSPLIVDYLKAQLDDNIRITTGKANLAKGKCHILVGGRPDRKLIAKNKDLRVLIVPWTGIPPQTLSLLSDFPHISLHNIHHNSVPVAEMTIALLLAAAKQIVPADQALRQGDWSMRYETDKRALLLNGKSAVLLGYGSIGRLVARSCRALGMHTIAIKRQAVSTEDELLAHEIHSTESLADFLPSADALVITLPLTALTKGFIGKRELSLLPKNCVLVNVGRATIVNEEALYVALKSREIGAAGLDVWYNYPDDEESRTQTAPSSYPFGELDNVVMSPHRAGDVPESDFLRMDQLAILLNAAARSEPIPNRVDLHVGY